MHGWHAGAARSAAGLGLLLATALVLAGTQPASAARARADLRVDSVTIQPASVSPGGALRLRAVVRNAGRRRAGRSRLGFWLSNDQRRGKEDVALRGTVRTKALRRGKRRAGGRNVTVPASVPAGAWFVLACADRARKVKESRERNNCQASKSTLKVVAAPAPGGGFVSNDDPADHDPADR